MAIQKTDAIVIRTMPFRTTSLIVTFFTKNFGKVKGIVKGVRQEGEMRSPTYELFTKAEIIFYEKLRSDLHLISESFILDSYESIRSKMDAISYASYFVELTDQLTEFHDPHPEIFNLLEFAFRYLPALPGEKLSRIFEMKILYEIGWLPNLEACMHCQTKTFEKVFFSPAQGALFCSKCVLQVQDANPISSETLATLKYYAHHDLEACLKHPVSIQSEKGLSMLMQRFFDYRLQRPLKTKIFLEKVKSVLAF